LGEGLSNAREHAASVAQDIIVPEAQYTITLRFEEPGPSIVVGCSLGVLPAIQLDNQFFSETGEVREVGSDRHLPPPFVARKLRS